MATSFVTLAHGFSPVPNPLDLLLDLADDENLFRALNESFEIEICSLSTPSTQTSGQEYVHVLPEQSPDLPEPTQVAVHSHLACDLVREALVPSFECEIYSLSNNAKSWEIGPALSEKSPAMPEPTQESEALVSRSFCVSPTTSMMTPETNIASVTKSTPKKRAFSQDTVLSAEEMALRRQRNREHAKRSRLRKKNMAQDLEKSLTDLKKEKKSGGNSPASPVPTQEIESLVSPSVCVSPTINMVTPETNIARATKSNMPKKRSFSKDTELSEEDEARRQRNCDHARRSRLRKKNKTQNLQQWLADLKLENKKLRKKAYAFIKKKDIELMLLLQRRMFEGAADKFLTGVKRPENRVMSTKTISFLESLRRNTLQKTTTNTKSRREK